ncbi:Voltage-gated ion channel, partial [Globisporangium splendens]
MDIAVFVKPGVELHMKIQQKQNFPNGKDCSFWDLFQHSIFPIQCSTPDSQEEHWIGHARAVREPVSMTARNLSLSKLFNGRSATSVKSGRSMKSARSVKSTRSARSGRSTASRGRRESIEIVLESFRLNTREATLLEDEVEDAVDPNAMAIRIWHQVLLGGHLFELCIIPFLLTFQDRSETTLSMGYSAFFVCEVLFFFDFYVQAHTGFYEEGNLVKDKRRTRMKYFTSYGFALDLIAIIPLSLLPVPVSVLRAALDVHKLIRCWRIKKYVSNLDDFYARHFVALKLLKAVATTMYMSHLVACVRFCFGYDEHHTNHWLPSVPSGELSVRYRYLMSLFWSFGVLTGLFEGELPHSIPEFIFTILVALCGFSLFAMLLSTFFMVSRCQSDRAEEVEARINQLKHLLSFHRVPEDLQQQAIDYLRRYYTDTESNDREATKLLCPSIAKDIQIELMRATVAEIPIFKGCNDHFATALTGLLEMIAVPAQFTLWQAGDFGDALYIVHSGAMNVLINGVKVREMRKGICFGELSVFSTSPRTAMVVSASYAVLHKLSRFHCERVVEGYPDCATIISNHVTTLLHNAKAFTSSAHSQENAWSTGVSKTSSSSGQYSSRRSASNLLRRSIAPFSDTKKSQVIPMCDEETKILSSCDEEQQESLKSPRTRQSTRDMQMSYYSRNDPKQQRNKSSVWRVLLLKSCIDADSRLRMWWILVLNCVFSVITMTSGFFLFAYVIGNFMDIVELLNIEDREFNAKLGSVRHLLAHFKLPPSLEEKLKTFSFFKRYHSITQEHLLERCLPPSLLTDIWLVHLKPMIAKVAFLRGMKGSVTRMLVSQFSQPVVLRGQYVCRFDEEGSDMFFVFTGVLEVLLPIDEVPMEDEDPESAEADKPSIEFANTPLLDASRNGVASKLETLKKVNEISVGSYFGENGLFTKSLRNAHVRAQTSCILYKLSRESLELVFERYPAWKLKVIRIANLQNEQQRLNRLSQEEQNHRTDESSGSSLPRIDMLNKRAEKMEEEMQLVRIKRSDSVKRTIVQPSSAIWLRLWEKYFRKQLPSLVHQFVHGTAAQSALHLFWLRLMVFCTVFSAIVVPYRISLDSMDRDTTVVHLVKGIELFCEITFILDIWFSIRVKECSTSMELYEQNRRDAYKKDRMLWDVIAALPLYRMVVNISSYLAELDRRSVANELNRFRSIWLLYMLMIYWVRCFYLGIAMYSGYSDDWNSWLPSKEVEITDPENPSSTQLMLRLLRGLFYATTALVKKGRTFTPDSSLNFVFSIICSFVGLLVMSFVIGEVASLFISYIGIEVDFRRNHIAVEFYLARLNVSSALKKRAHAFMFSLWSSHTGVNYEAIFQEMPLSIRTACALHISQQLLERFMGTVFRPISWNGSSELETFTNAIAQELRFEDYPRDEFVVVEGNISKAMYLVIKGHLALQSNTHKALLKPVGLRSGDFFGERGLLGCAVSTFSVRAIRACDLMSLSSESLLKVINRHTFSRLAFLVAQQSYRKIKAEVTAWCSSASMEGHCGNALHAVLLEYRAKTKDRLKRRSSSTVNALAPEDASDFPSRVKAMVRALESPTECYSAFRGFLQIVSPHDPLDWKASFGHTVQLAVAPIGVDPHIPVPAQSVDDVSVPSDSAIQEDTHDAVDGDPVSARTGSQEIPFPRAGPSIDLIPMPSMDVASADRGEEAPPNGGFVELPPRPPSALDTQRRSCIYSSSKARLQLVEDRDTLAQLPDIANNATEDAMHADLVEDAAAGTRRRSSIELPVLHAASTQLNDLKDAEKLLPSLLLSPSRWVVLLFLVSAVHSRYRSPFNEMMPQPQQRSADAPSAPLWTTMPSSPDSGNTSDEAGGDPLFDLDDAVLEIATAAAAAAHGGSRRRSDEGPVYLGSSSMLPLPVEHAISAVYEEVTRDENAAAGENGDDLWRLHTDDAADIGYNRLARENNRSRDRTPRSDAALLNRTPSGTVDSDGSITPLPPSGDRAMPAASNISPPKADASALKRARRSEIEKRSRQRRQGVLRRMRDDAHRLECLYADLLEKKSSSGEIDALVKPSRRPRSTTDIQTLYARLSVLAQTLTDEHSHIKRLLHEHELFCKVVSADPEPSAAPPAVLLDAEFPMSASFDAAFDLLSLEDCYAIVRESHETICRFEEDSESDVFATTGATFMGWTDRRKFDSMTSALQYGFRKKFYHECAESLLLKTWDMFRDEHKMAKLSFDTSVKMKFEVLQTVNDDLYIIRRDHVHPEMAPLTFLTVHVLFRLQTREGFTLCFRTIPAPAIQSALEPHEIFFDVFHWTHFNHIYDERGVPVGCEVVTGGSIGDPSMLVARHWLFELMISPQMNLQPPSLTEDRPSSPASPTASTSVARPLSATSKSELAGRTSVAAQDTDAKTAKPTRTRKAATAAPTAARRARRSEIEKQSRQRRVGSVQVMRGELDRLEREYLRLSQLAASEASETRGLAVHPREIQELRNKFLLLSREARGLRQEQKQLHKMLHERQLFHDSFRALAHEFSDDDEFPWSAVAHATFAPLSPEKCFELIRDSYDVISRFEVGGNYLSSGASYLGWADKRRLDEETSSMHFTFTKRFANQSTEHLMEESWKTYCNEDDMRKKVFSAAVQVKLEILQVINDDVFVVRRHTKYVAMGKAFHTVYLLYRIQTETGYTLCFRTIPAPSIEHSLEENEAWIELFHWTHLTRIVDEDGEQTGCEITFGGSIGASVMKFALHWMLELAMVVVRWENAVVAPMAIKP